MTVDDVALRQHVPRALSVLVRRGADFATAEDAVQDACIRALSAWRDELPTDPTGWLITVAWRAFLDTTRSDTARRDRELRFDTEPPPGCDPERRRHAAPLLPVRAPRSDDVVGSRVDAARRRWPHHPPDRAGLPRTREHHGATHQPRQADRRPGRCRSSRRRRHGDAGAVPRLQRGLFRRRRSRVRGHPTDPAAGRPGGRPRGPRVARPHAPAPRPPTQPHPTRRKHRAARRLRTAASGTRG